MNYKLVYIGKGDVYTAYVYEIENYYVYVVEGESGNLSGPSSIYKDLEPISSRMKLEEPRDYDQEKEQLAERIIQQKYHILKRKIDFENEENMQNFNI